jgi:hypothetical protein
MPGYNSSALSIVNQIKANLTDRYFSGFPILKELIQNADDASAEALLIGYFNGWSDADAVLLRHPGILVVNDGEFKEGHLKGLQSFGESSKTADTSSVGKFGFGQKAVFHLCDAFIAMSFGAGRVNQSLTINPFLDVEVTANKSVDWELGVGGLTSRDMDRLREVLGTGSQLPPIQGSRKIKQTKIKFLRNLRKHLN